MSTSHRVRLQEYATFPATEASVGQARRWMRKILAGHPRLDDAVCLLSETITNSVVHTRSAVIGVVLAEENGELMVEIIDGGSESLPTGCCHESGEMAESGRGIPLIRALSARWGFFEEGPRCVVWFVLAEQAGPGEAG